MGNPICNKLPPLLPGDWGCRDMVNVLELPTQAWVDGNTLYLQGMIQADTYDKVVYALWKAWSDKVVANGSYSETLTQNIWREIQYSKNIDHINIADSPFVRLALNKKRLQRIVADLGVKWISLNSQGGVMKVAYNIAGLVKTLGLKTYVGDLALCASSCSFIYHFGSERVAHHNALFMHHIGNSKNVVHEMQGVEKTEEEKTKRTAEEIKDWCTHEDDPELYCADKKSVEALKIYADQIVSRLTASEEHRFIMGEDVYNTPRTLKVLKLVDRVIKESTPVGSEGEGLQIYNDLHIEMVKYLEDNIDHLSPSQKTIARKIMAAKIEVIVENAPHGYSASGTSSAYARLDGLQIVFSREMLNQLNKQEPDLRAYWIFVNINLAYKLNFQDSILEAQDIFGTIERGLQ